MSKSGIPQSDAETIVDIIRELRMVGVNNNRPTIRACIAIGKVIAHLGARAQENDPTFDWVCQDVLNTDTVKVTRSGQSLMPEKIKEVIKRVCRKNKGQKKATVRPETVD
jgi:nitric oxide reductase NorQ protein